MIAAGRSLSARSSLQVPSLSSNVRAARGLLCVQAMSWQTPPAAVMRFSAFLEKILARTMQGTLGSSPLPRTLK